MAPRSVWTAVRALADHLAGRPALSRPLPSTCLVLSARAPPDYPAGVKEVSRQEMDLNQSRCGECRGVRTKVREPQTLIATGLSQSRQPLGGIVVELRRRVRVFFGVLLAGAVCVVVSLLPLRSAGQTPPPEGAKSSPPDTMPYVRPAVPEDCAPGGKRAIPARRGPRKTPPKPVPRVPPPPAADQKGGVPERQ